MSGITLYDIYHLNPETATEEVLRVSSAPYGTQSTDTPANTDYDDRVLEAGSVERFMFGQSRTYGQSEMASGNFLLSNLDSLLDYLENHKFDTRRFLVRWVPNNSTPLASATVIADLRMENADVTWDRLQLTLRDPLLELDIPAITATFLGTNDGDAFDVEGTANDIKGTLKPFLYGTVRNITPILVNSSSLIHLCNFDSTGNPIAVTTISNVRLNGNAAAVTLDTSIGGAGPLDPGDFATIADLAAATIASGKYATCLAKGAIRFNNLAPNEIVTMDVTEGSTSADRTVAQICKRLIKDRAGKVDGDFVSASITALDTAQSSVFGIYVTDNTKVVDCCFELLEGAGAYLVNDEEGKIEFGRLEDPSGGISVRDFEEDDIIVEEIGTLEQIPSQDPGYGIPPWKCITNARKHYRVFSETEFAGAVSVADRELLLKEFRKVSNETTSILSDHPLSPILEFTSLMDSLTDAATENARQLALRAPFTFNGKETLRRFWKLTVQEPVVYNLGNVITINTDRFNLNNNRKFVIIGYQLFFEKLRTNYFIWG